MTDRKINDYKLVVKGNADALNDCIAAMICAGWQPYGYPYRPEADGWHHQAMVKYEESGK